MSVCRCREENQYADFFRFHFVTLATFESNINSMYMLHGSNDQRVSYACKKLHFAILSIQ